MKTPLIIVFASLLIFSSCSNVVFEQPMPIERKNLTSFPEKWLGEWLPTDDDDPLTYTIARDYFYTDSNDPCFLSESFRLRRFQGYLVLSNQDDRGQWEVILAKRKKDVIYMYQFDDTNAEAVAVWNSVLGTEIPSTRSDNSNVTYILSPQNNWTLRQLILKGGVSPMMRLERAKS